MHGATMKILLCYFPAASKKEYIVFVRMITKLMNDFDLC